MNESGNGTESTEDIIKRLSFRRCSVDVKFENIGYSVKVKGSQKTVLSGISGSFKHGRLNCIMGPSGAGKSSLLNVLTGFNTITKGTIYVNKVPYEASKCISTMSRISSYILQDDYLLGELTSRETVIFAARFKLPKSMVEGNHFYKEIADQVLSLTGLSETADRRVRQLSGGQRKRLAVSVELVNYPPILFLDECTTGLDSTSCYRLIKVLKTLATCGCNIITTIHQPNSLCYQMFDWLYVLAPGGRLAYNGHPMSVSLALKMIGVCDTSGNVADVLFEHGNIPKLSDSWQTLQKKDDFSKPSEDRDRPESVQHCTGIEGDIYIWLFEKVNPEYGRPFRKPELPTYRGKELIRYCSAQRLSVISQTLILISRSLKQMFRDQVLFLACVTYVLAALLYGHAFFNMAKDDIKLALNPGMLFFLTDTVIIAASALAVVSTEDHLKTLVRDNINGWYGIGVYNLVRILVDALINLATMTLFTPVVWIMSRQPMLYVSLPTALLVLALHTMAIHQVAFLLCLKRPTQENLLLPFLLLIIQIIFGGYNINVADLPEWIQWLGFINFSSYSFFGLMKASYSPIEGVTVKQCESGSLFCARFPTGDSVLEQYKIARGSPWEEFAKLLVCHLLLFAIGWPLLIRRVRIAKKVIARIQ